MKRLLHKTLVVLSVTIFLISALIVITPQGRTAYRTILFIPQVVHDIPVKPQEWLTKAPVLLEINYWTNNGYRTADLYVPATSGKHGAVLFFQGVVPGGRYDPRIVALGEGLARSGMVVMIPWLNTQIEERIVTDDIDNLVMAFQHLRTLEKVDPNRVGMGGICVGASLATVAAQDSRIRDDVKFVNFFAGYYDAFDFIKSIASRIRFSEGYTQPWEPDNLTLNVFRHHLIAGLRNVEDRVTLTSIFFDVDTDAKIDTLSPEGLVVYRLLNGVPFEDTDGLIEKLSPETRESLRRISPSTHVDQLQARMLIMHDRADRLVPSEESHRLAQALGENSNTYHTEFSFFQREIQVHIGDSKGVGPLAYMKELFKLFMHMYNIMGYTS